jgi:hypothetical protein
MIAVARATQIEPARPGSFPRSFPANSGAYLRETIAERCRSGGATRASHGWGREATPWSGCERAKRAQ